LQTANCKRQTSQILSTELALHVKPQTPNLKRRTSKV
jgi:hypothetical protein